MYLETIVKMDYEEIRSYDLNNKKKTANRKFS